jgi:hypothetical protein
VHHRDETLTGISDPLLLGRWAASLGELLLVLRAGVSLPLGHTEAEPVRAGATWASDTSTSSSARHLRIPRPPSSWRGPPEGAARGLQYIFFKKNFFKKTFNTKFFFKIFFYINFFFLSFLKKQFFFKKNLF